MDNKDLLINELNTQNYNLRLQVNELKEENNKLRLEKADLKELIIHQLGGAVDKVNEMYNFCKKAESKMF